MRRERGPRLDMELVHGSGKGVARGKERDEDEAKRRCVHTLSLNRASYLLLTNHQTQKILKKLLVS